MTSRSRLLVGILVAALTATVVIALLRRGGDGNRAAIDYSAVATVPEGIETGCPPPGRDLSYAADGVLPDGAVAVRLCNGPPQRTESGGSANPRFDAPDDVLTTDVADLVDLANGLEPAATDGRYCPADAAAQEAYWFLYPGGDARAVLFDGGGCRDATMAPGRLVEGGQALAAAFAEDLLAQRDQRVPPGTNEAGGCNPNDAPRSAVATADRVAFATLTYCTLPDGVRYSEGHLSKAQVATVNRDIRAGGEPGPAGCAGHSYRALVGMTAWGDRVMVSGTCGRYELGPGVTWTPSQKVARMLDGLSRGALERQCNAFVRGHRNHGCPHW